jgi:ABC-type uncharacterized transport system auxiliary subunit
MTARATAIVLFCLTLAPACALLSKSEPIEPRYYSPELTPKRGAEVSPAGELELRLGPVRAAEYMDRRVVHRDSMYEIRFYEERLWTESPGVYVRRAIARALFNARGVRQVLSGPATTLAVDVAAFEEVVTPAHTGRVTLAISLSDEREVLLSRVITRERPISETNTSAAPYALVEALAGALAEAVDAVADATTAELRSEGADRPR